MEITTSNLYRNNYEFYLSSYWWVMYKLVVHNIILEGEYFNFFYCLWVDVVKSGQWHGCAGAAFLECRANESEAASRFRYHCSLFVCFDYLREMRTFILDFNWNYMYLPTYWRNCLQELNCYHDSIYEIII